MIASKIGKTFLEAYNQKYDKEYSAKEFFDKEYFELFYNHPKYFFWPGNSEFVQGVKTLKSGKIGKDIKEDGKVLKFDSQEKANDFLNKIKLSKGEEVEIRKVKNKKEFVIIKTLDSVQKSGLLSNFHNKVKNQLNNQQFDYSVVIGFPASSIKEDKNGVIKNDFATTSGLVTDINTIVTEDEIYSSWLGGALGIGVGEFSIFYDNASILLAIFEGWRIYRKFLNDESIEKLAGNKINSWNGQWVNFYFGENYYENPDFSMLDDDNFFKKTNADIVIETIKWSRLFFNLSRKLSNQTLTGYVYSLGQTNKTIGFIPFRFSEAESLSQTYKKLFGDFDALEQQNDYELLMGKTIREACKLGSIGIQALEPKGLVEYFKDKSKILKFTKSAKIKGKESAEDFVFRDQKTKKKQYGELITFRTYKIWLITMITKNKEEDLNYSSEIAKKLSEFRASDKKGSAKFGNLLNELFKSSNKKMFLSNLTDILKLERDDKKEYLKRLRDRVHLMNNEDFGYFATLLKFDYAYQQKEN